MEPYSTALVRVPPEAVQESDLRYLQKAVNLEYNGMTLEDLFEQLAGGWLGIWRLEGEAQGIIAWKLLKHPGGLELFIWAVVGKGYIKAFPEIFEQVKAEANRMGCRWIAGDTRSRALDKVYAFTGAKEISKHFVMEL